LFPERAGFWREGFGEGDVESDEEVAAFAGFGFGEPAAADAELVGVLGALGDAEADGAVEGADEGFGTEDGVPWGDLEVEEEVWAVGGEVRVGGVADAEVEVAGGCAAGAGFAFAGDAETAAVDCAWGDADLEVAGGGFAGVAVDGLEGERAGGAVEGFIEGDEEIAFDVVAAGGGGG
jgi:hypothetical protein